MAGAHLSLVIPRLFAPITPERQSDKASLKALKILLARAERMRHIDGHEAMLFALFGVATNGALPVAAVTHAHDANSIDDAWWLRIDPVHLRADNGRVFMLGNDALDISADEAHALTAELGMLFTEQEGMLTAPHPKRWYLRLPRDPGAIFHALPDVLGGDIHDHLPYDRQDGAIGKHWRRLLNEAQMLLYASTVNAARERRGVAPVNSVWFWGGGAAPEVRHSRFTRVWSNDALCLGLAKLGAMARSTVPLDAEAWRAEAREGDHLIVLNSALVTGGEFVAASLDRNWFSPLLAMLKARSLTGIDLYPGNGRVFRLNPTAAARWWKRSRDLDAYL